MRLGIGSFKGVSSQVDFVLGKWSDDDKKELEPVLEKAIEAVKSFGTAGLDRTMNQYNTKI